MRIQLISWQIAPHVKLASPSFLSCLLMTRANIKLQRPPVSIRKYGLDASKQIKQTFQNNRRLQRCIMQWTQWGITLLSHFHFCSHCSRELIAVLTTGHCSPNVLSKTYLLSLPLTPLLVSGLYLVQPGRFRIQPFLVENYNFPWRVILIQTYLGGGPQQTAGGRISPFLCCEFWIMDDCLSSYNLSHDSHHYCHNSFSSFVISRSLLDHFSH